MKKKLETTKVQVTLANDMVARIDRIAETIGVSRSAYLATVIGQVITTQEQAMSALPDLLDRIAEQKK